MANKKFKVLVFSDHALSTSGEGTQTRKIINRISKKYISCFICIDQSTYSTSLERKKSYII